MTELHPQRVTPSYLHGFRYSLVNRLLKDKSEARTGTELSAACEEWAKRTAADYDSDLFARELRGYALLDRYTLKRNLPGLFARLASSPLLIGELIAHCITMPYLYLDAVDTLALESVDNKEIVQALGQLKKYLLTIGSYVSVLYDLAFHLEHSSPWDISLRDLLTKARRLPRNATETEIACATFLHRGLYEADRHIKFLINEGYWRKLPGKENLEVLWEQVSEAANSLVETVRLSPEQTNRIEDLFSAVDKEKKLFMNTLNSAVAILPQRIATLYQARIGQGLWPEGSVEIEVAEDCRAIVCGKEDFHDILYYILDNTKKHGREGRQMTTKLRFTPATKSVPRVTMEVSHDSIVEIPDSYWSFGGLRSIDKIVTAMSGVPPIIRSTSNPDEPFLIATFWAWPMRESDIT